MPRPVPEEHRQCGRRPAPIPATTSGHPLGTAHVHCSSTRALRKIAEKDLGESGVEESTVTGEPSVEVVAVCQWIQVGIGEGLDAEVRIPEAPVVEAGAAEEPGGEAR